MFREQAHDACTLAELAARLDAGLGRGLGRHEEFVTALLVEIDQESGRTSIFNCGHPPPLLIQAATDDAATRRVTLLEVPAPAPPLGLLALGDCSDAQLVHALQPDDQLLLYTDGVTEARDANGQEFGLDRFTDFIIRRHADGLPLPETLRLLMNTILDYHDGPLRDDATVLFCEWRGPTRNQRLTDAQASQPPGG
jgi:serine phosphatase RsbU (regulator of sigma subunit)